MSLLAASTSKPSVALHQSPNVISSLSPLVNLALQFQKLLSSAAFVVFIRTYLAARVIGEALWLSSYLAASRALLFSQPLAVKTAAMTQQMLWSACNSKRSRRLRKKVEFEFFVLLLGPGGNALCLMLFWPGWLFLGATAWAFWSRAG